MAITLALFGALAIVALLMLWSAIRAQKEWSVDGEVRDPMKRRWMRIMVLGGSTILIMIYMQIFYVFNPPPPRFNPGPPPQTQR
jgi:hypothetical protein